VNARVSEASGRPHSSVMTPTPTSGVVLDDPGKSISIRDASLNFIETPKKKFNSFSTFASACIAGNFGFGLGLPRPSNFGTHFGFGSRAVWV
jgi:hypothetical protein